MKLIGLIGGMSWQSTVGYYQIINQTIQAQLGCFHSAKCILYSVDFQEIETCQVNGDWDKSAKILSEAAQKLECAGAEFIVICTNTMHKVAVEIQKSITIPILHIADVTADELIKQKIERVALLGTQYTMEHDFYKNKLIDKDIKVLIPNEVDRKLINHVIYQELCLGLISRPSQKEFLRIIDQLKINGAQGVILGCTEIGMLVKQSDTIIQLFDTTEIHATQAALLSLSV